MASLKALTENLLDEWQASGHPGQPKGVTEKGKQEGGGGLSHPQHKALQGAPLPRQGPGEIVSFQIPTSTVVVQKRT